MSKNSTAETVSAVSATPGASATTTVSANAPETPVTSKTGTARDAVSSAPEAGSKEQATPDTATAARVPVAVSRETNRDPMAWMTTGTPVSVSAVQRSLSDANMRTVTLMAVKEKEGPGYKFTVGLPDGRVNVYWVEDNPRFARASAPGKYGTAAIQVTRNDSEYVRDVRVSVYESGTAATPSDRRVRLTVLGELSSGDRQELGGIWARTQRYSMSERVLDLLFPPPDEPGITDRLHPAGRESTAPRTTPPRTTRTTPPRTTRTTPPVARTPASTPALAPPASATPATAGVPMVVTPAAGS